ncbi:MAG: UpxY family transcription antiterminator [Nitrospirota bacterium]
MATSPDWYAIHVRSRHEFVVFAELSLNGIEAFLPSVTKVRQWKDRKKQVRFALFPGYCFVRTAPHQDEYRMILKIKGVVTFVCLEKNKPVPVPSEEITSLKSMIDSGAEPFIYPGLELGARVKVTRGPLRDVEGVLVKKENVDIFVINIGILGRSAGIRMSADDIEAC